MKRLIKVSHFSDGSLARPYDEKRFTEIFGITYLPRLEFANWEVEQWIRKKCAKAYEKGKIGQLALWLGKFHEKALKEELFADISLKWIHDKIGYGLFANQDLKKWELIGEYTGIVRRRNLFFPNVNDYCFMYPRAWKSLKAFTIDSERHGNFTRFINHSDTPNCESVAIFFDGVFHILFRTIKDIPAGTELTYDYGDVY